VPPQDDRRPWKERERSQPTAAAWRCTATHVQARVRWDLAGPRPRAEHVLGTYYPAPSENGPFFPKTQAVEHKTRSALSGGGV
jgi:hypothetical protein